MTEQSGDNSFRFTPEVIGIISRWSADMGVSRNIRMEAGEVIEGDSIKHGVFLS